VLAVFAKTEPSPVEPGFGLFKWRWAVPVAAAATAAAIWVAVPKNERADEFERTVASTLEAPAASPGAAVPQTAPPSADAAASAAETKKPAPRRDAPSGSTAVGAEQDAFAKEAPAEKLERFETQRSAELAQAPASAAAPAPPAAPRGAQAAQAAQDQAAPAPEQNRLEARSRTLGEAAAEVVSPDPLVRWRIVAARRLERSTNAGRTWEPVRFPQPIDLIAVRTPSAMTAIVMTADGREFRTDDQGKTWNLVQP
jgi:photosystem II stability/assembly factor-like uncharacterized protein